MSKALLIKSYTNKNTGVQGKWNELDDAPSYIQGIQTGQILDNLSAENLSGLISGVPTPWARAKLFKFALQSLATPNPAVGDTGLQQFYKLLYGEWQGFLATIALYPDRIRFSNPVSMDLTGDDYDIASAFGRMLFEDKDLWCNQDEMARTPNAQPYIHLIYYRDHLVGGTSPMTGVFTGADYSNLGTDASDIIWYREGKFEDPTRFLTPDQLQKVYLFVKNLNSNLANFESKVNSQRGNKPNLDLNGLKQMSRKWEAAIKEQARNITLDEIGPIARYNNLSVPFSILFRSEVPVYLKPDFTFTYCNPNGEFKKITDIQSLLSEEENVLGWAERNNDFPSLKDAPVYFLKVQDVTQNGAYYFTIPFSEQGIEIFRNDLPSILGYKPEQGVSLKAEIVNNGENAILAVHFAMLIDNKKVSLGTREYIIRWQTKPQKVILWPNFISDKWSRYYLYSHQSEASQPRFIPIFQSRREIIKIGNKFFTPDYKSPDGSQFPVKIQELASTPANAGDSLPRYQIAYYDRPITGLSVSVKQGGKEVNAGFLIIRQDIIKDITDISISYTATIGFDFGSNNTCVYYKTNNNIVSPVEFKNYRAMLVGKEILSPNRVADMDELFFFTNYDAADGQFKSWLHEHDSRCIQYTSSEEIAGGVPVNRPNVQVNEMNDNTIQTQAGCLHYNMKWTPDSLRQKKAFIKSLWLQTCAFLFSKQIMPTSVNWSCPGAMQQSDITDLGLVYESLSSITPIINHQVKPSPTHSTEAEAICSYAIAQPDFGLTSDNLFLGIDVGGSTSDIMILANDFNTGKPSLIKESSVRIAASAFFHAVTGSQLFRDALVTFHEGHKTKVNVMNIKELNEPSNKDKAPYYLNCIFDQLKPEEYKIFYESLRDNNARFVFAIPAYVTGILLYYSGMLIGKAIKDGLLSADLQTVEILPFGKGGRLFHWLYSAAGVKKTDEYYMICLNKGIGSIVQKEVSINVRQQLAANNKTEVARGLCNPRAFGINPNVGKTDICGETGVLFRAPDGTQRQLDVCEELDGSFFKDLTKLTFSRGGNFDTFMDVFIRFISRTTKIYDKDVEELKRDIRDVPGRIRNFLQDDVEYAKAENADEEQFPFHQPIIVAEAASYLNTLIEKIFAY